MTRASKTLYVSLGIGVVAGTVAGVIAERMLDYTRDSAWMIGGGVCLFVIVAVQIGVGMAQGIREAGRDDRR